MRLLMILDAAVINNGFELVTESTGVWRIWETTVDGGAVSKDGQLWKPDCPESGPLVF